MEQNEYKSAWTEFEDEELVKNDVKSKKKTIYNLKVYKRNEGYCETCPREIGKKCNCKW